MKVEFERSGGFAGMHVAAKVDTEALPSEEAHRLKENLEAASFFDLPEKIYSPQGGADRFQYRITVEEPARVHTVEFSDAAATNELQALAQQLTLLARSMKR